MECVICRYVEECRQGTNPRFVKEFEHSILTVGEHQYFEGYCVLLLRQHVRELHELEGTASDGLYRELMHCTRAIARAYAPAKLNHASYGNSQPHVHWHIFPRYLDDPDRLTPPWTHMDRFAERATTTEMAVEVRERLLGFL